MGPAQSFRVAWAHGLRRVLCFRHCSNSRASSSGLQISEASVKLLPRVEVGFYKFRMGPELFARARQPRSRMDRRQPALTGVLLAPRTDPDISSRTRFRGRQGNAPSAHSHRCLPVLTFEFDRINRELVAAIGSIEDIIRVDMLDQLGRAACTSEEPMRTRQTLGTGSLPTHRFAWASSSYCGR